MLCDPPGYRTYPSVTLGPLSLCNEPDLIPEPRPVCMNQFGRVRMLPTRSRAIIRRLLLIKVLLINSLSLMLSLPESAGNSLCSVWAIMFYRLTKTCINSLSRDITRFCALIQSIAVLPIQKVPGKFGHES